MLIVESEINRVHLLREGRLMKDDIRNCVNGLRTVSSLGSSAALLVTGFLACRKSKTVSTDTKPSWFQTACKGLQMAGDLWLAFREHK